MDATIRRTLQATQGNIHAVPNHVEAAASIELRPKPEGISGFNIPTSCDMPCTHQ
jgi:hypothetical protein